MGTFKFKSLNELVATVTGKKMRGVSVGTTKLEVKDDNNVVRGTIDITIKDKSSQGDEPTGITVSPKSCKLEYLGNNTKIMSVTITPSNAANKHVLWESSNTSVATVSSSGKIVAKNKSGSATITAYTYDKSLYDTCAVSVTAQGTFITGVTPSAIGTIPANGAVQHFSVTKSLMDGKDSGFGVYGSSTGFTTYDSGDNRSDGFSQAFPVNWGTARTIEMTVRGNSTDDNGVTITIQQETCDKSKGFIGGSSSTFDAHPSTAGQIMWDNVKFYAAYSSNHSIARSILSSVDITDSRESGGNPVSWCRFGKSDGSSNINLVYRGSTSDGVAKYDCDLICDENNTGSTRKAYAHFPTYIYNSQDHTYSAGYNVYTITQSA